MKVKKLPAFLKEYFWDVNFNGIDPKENTQYVIARILQKGNEKAIKWLFKNYPKENIKEVVVVRRGFSPKTANFWASLLKIDKRKVVCLQKPYLQMHQNLWPY